MTDFLHSSTFTWVLLPLLIFCTRIVDVSLDTLRVIFISRGVRYLAPIVAFFEVLIWLIAISQIMRNLSNPICYIAYAGGFATGNYVGMILESRLAIGTVILRVITGKDAVDLIKALTEAHYGLTCIKGEGPDGMVNIIFMLVPRLELQHAIGIIKQHQPNAIYSVEDVRAVKEGIFPNRGTGGRWNSLPILGWFSRDK
jgi:uncharacterized protein YebE (UPF0316 family)